MFRLMLSLIVCFGPMNQPLCTNHVAYLRQISSLKMAQYQRTGAYHQHKHLIFSSIILAILVLPRLVISFISSCMKLARDPKLYFTGYFISFIPSLLTCFIFVLPSKMYKKEFNNTINEQWKTLRRRFTFP